MASTFGGNPLASAVAIASLDVIKDEKLAERYEEESNNRFVFSVVLDIHGCCLSTGLHSWGKNS